MRRKSSISTYNRVLWITVLTLFVSVCCTTYVWADLMEGYSLDDSNAIALTPVNLNEEQVMNIEILPETVVLSEEESSRRAVARYQKMTQSKVANSGFEASDENTVWSMNTQVDIFKVSYDETGEVTVLGDGIDKLIAPGTENSYVFKLKNTGNTSLTYKVDVEAYFSPDGVSIPVEARLNRLDGDWIVGDELTYVTIDQLNGAADEGALKSGRLATFVLDWLWPFDGDDVLDTMLGNRAVDEDLTLTIVINTIAEIEPAPNTGDNMSLGLWAGLTGVSFVALIVLILIRRSKEDESEEAQS